MRNKIVQCTKTKQPAWKWGILLFLVAALLVIVPAGIWECYHPPQPSTAAGDETAPYYRVPETTVPDLINAGHNPNFPTHRYPVAQRTEIRDYNGNVVGYLETIK